MPNAGDLFEDIFKREAAKKIKLTLFDLFRRLSIYTPVDTGRARAAWLLAGGSPSRFVPYAPEGTYPPPEPPAISVVLGETYYLTNNVVYIEALDKGHSRQAPTGITVRAVAETTRKFSS